MLEILGKTNIDFMGKRAYRVLVFGHPGAAGDYCGRSKSVGGGESGDRLCRRHRGAIEIR